MEGLEEKGGRGGEGWGVGKGAGGEERCERHVKTDLISTSLKFGHSCFLQ